MINKSENAEKIIKVEMFIKIRNAGALELAQAYYKSILTFIAFRAKIQAK